MLKDKDEAFIKESIIDPDKVIADGYQSGIMPGNFAQTVATGPARRSCEVPF